MEQTDTDVRQGKKGHAKKSDIKNNLEKITWKKTGMEKMTWKKNDIEKKRRRKRKHKRKWSIELYRYWSFKFSLPHIWHYWLGGSEKSPHPYTFRVAKREVFRVYRLVLQTYTLTYLIIKSVFAN